MSSAEPNRERVRRYRTRMRARGLRPLQVWVPDMRSVEFVDQAHAQSRAVSASPSEEEDQSFVDSIGELNS